MPTLTYTPLATITLGSNQSTITFSSIPSTYRDLRLVVVGKTAENVSGRDFIYRFNSDSGTNYSRVLMYGASSGYGAGTGSTETGIYLQQSGSAVSGFGVTEIDVIDYSVTNKQKVLLTKCNYKDGSEIMITAYRWASNSAVTSISITPNLGYNIVAGSTATLYGIAG